MQHVTCDAMFIGSDWYEVGNENFSIGSHLYVCIKTDTTSNVGITFLSFLREIISSACLKPTNQVQIKHLTNLLIIYLIHIVVPFQLYRIRHPLAHFFNNNLVRSFFCTACLHSWMEHRFVTLMNECYMKAIDRLKIQKTKHFNR